MLIPLVPDGARFPVAMGALLLASCLTMSAQTMTQPTLRAAFLFNFTKFVEWPAASSDGGPLSVCVLDDAAVEGSLAELLERAPVAGRAVTLVKDARNRSLRVCHVLYLGDPEPARVSATLDELKAAPVLTVGDGDRFVRGGGMIGLFVDGGRMRFAINPDAVQRAGLHLSSRLLSLAKIVKEGRHGQS